MQIIRRLGASPIQRNCLAAECCPDIFELSDGSFAVNGTEATAALADLLPPDATLTSKARIVIISRETLILAKNDIPDI